MKSKIYVISTIVDFADVVKSNIQNYLDDSCKDAIITIETRAKNNNQIFYGLTVRKVNRAVAPCIYLEQYWSRYQEGEELESTLQNIAKEILEHSNNIPFDDSISSDIQSWDWARKRIMPRLINKAWNEDMLSRNPHTDIADLAVVYVIALEVNSNTGAIYITDQLLETWGKTVEDLKAAAIENIEASDVITFRPMSDILMDLVSDQTGIDWLSAETASCQAEDAGMFVASFKNMLFGASSILSPKLMKHVANMFHGNFVILPSSVHEVIIVKSPEPGHVDDFVNMVSEVNRTAVDPVDRLSDNIYAWDEEGGLHTVPV